MSAIFFTNAGKSLSIERRGYVWLPIGRPSGFARTSAAFQNRDAARPEQRATRLANPRLDIVFISFLLLDFRAEGEKGVGRLRDPFLLRMLMDLQAHAGTP